MKASRAYVLEARLALADGADPAAAGAAVTVELCGHWQHDGPCRWPHNSEIDAEREPALFRTLFLCGAAEEARLRERVERALRDAQDWDVVGVRARPLQPAERGLAERLRGPRGGG